jgi:hypothetical protein
MISARIELYVDRKKELLRNELFPIKRCQCPFIENSLVRGMLIDYEDSIGGERHNIEIREPDKMIRLDGRRSTLPRNRGCLFRTVS